MATDIADREDIALLVRTFYTRAFADPVLGPIFIDVARMDLDEHMPIMCDFWEAALLGGTSYHRNAFRPHAELNAKMKLEFEHFTRWVGIWTAVVDELFEGDVAEAAKFRARRMSIGIYGKLQVYGNPPA